MQATMSYSLRRPIMVSGFAGSGKSSLANALGTELGLRVVHASSILREMAIHGIEALENESPEKIRDWWESSEAKKFMQRRIADGSLDMALDKRLGEMADRGNIVLDSWTMPYLYEKPATRIWLHASAEVRAKRVSERDSMPYNEVLAKIRARDEETKALYQRLYNFTMGEGLGRFDAVIDTDSLTREQVFRKAIDVARKGAADGTRKDRH